MRVIFISVYCLIIKQLLNPQPISVLEGITDQIATENQTATFECWIQINYPEIPLSWYKGTQKLDSNGKYEISSDGNLHILKIKNCETKDQGHYCVVCGPHISSAKLSITGEGLMVSIPVCNAPLLHHQELVTPCSVSFN